MKRVTGVLVGLGMVVSLLAFEPSPAQALDSTATGETRVFSTIVSGNYASTGSSDNVYEQLRERSTGGKPSTRQSQLIHEWTFEIGSNAGSVTFSIEAYRPPNGEGDDFRFSYSNNGGGVWTELLVVTKDEDDDALQTASLPDATFGTVLIRAEDTNWAAGNSTRDYLFVDEMFISTDVAGNDPPTAVNDPDSGAISVNEGDSVAVTVLDNDSDPDDGIDPATVTASNGTYGTTSVEDGIVTYTHNGTENFIDTFTYTVNDYAGQTSNVATVSIIVTPVNDPPVANNDTGATSLDTETSVAVLANDTDPEGNELTIDSVSTPVNGGSTSITDDTITYTPETGYVGSDSFTYTISDGQGGTDSANVIVTISGGPTNNPPNAADDAASTDIDTPIDIQVLANDTDPDGDLLTISSTSEPANGSAQITVSTITYTPDPGYDGIDSFTYGVSDGQGGSDTANVTITVTNPSNNTPPSAANDTASTNVSTGISIPVLDNDDDPDDDSLTITSVSSPTGSAGGTAVVTGNRVTYTPSSAGTGSFFYTVTDGQPSSSATGTVTVTVASLTPITVSPGANLAQAAINAGSGATIILQPGVYQRQSIVPLANQTFIGYGAVMDGKRRTQYAFQNLNNVAGVTIEGIEVKNYKPGQYHGAIEFRSTDWADDDFGPKTNWVLRDVWSHDNNGDGIFVGDGAWLYNVRSTDNKWLGVGGHGIDLQFFGGELARNSTTLRNQQIGDHSGGMKLTKAREIMISGMHVHNNGGPGIWLDVSILDATIEKSLITDNQSPGVRYEISYDGFIRDNIFLRNGLTDPNYTNDPWVWGASISIRTSRNVWVEDNFIADSGAGIMVIDMPHRDGERGNVQAKMRDIREYASIENHIFRNTVIYTGRAGAAVGGSNPSIPRVFEMNEFDYNDYIGVDFWWKNDGPPYFGRSYTWEEWHAVGNDLNTPNLLTQRPDTPQWSNPW